MGKENHVFAPAYKEEDVKELVKICDHMVFNSFSQLEKYKNFCKETSVGIRINPECSTQGIMRSMIHVQRVRVSV